MHQFNAAMEAEYVLGMADLYDNDDEIRALLKLKGYSDTQVAQVIELVKRQVYEKRIRQSKRILLIGLTITVILGPLWFFLENSGMYSDEEELMGRSYARSMISFAFYGCLYGIGQTLYGAYRFINYSHKLKRINLST